MEKSRKRLGAKLTALVVAALCFFPCQELAQVRKPSAGSATTSKTGVAPRRTAVRQGKSSVRKARSSRRGRETRARRFARLKLEPQRIEEIQRALASAGYLNQEPNGVWDQATRDAMRRYQADNGFPTTGLPEAKTLMKLGLGPHPLPEELDPASSARASTESQPSDASPASNRAAEPAVNGSPH